MAFVGVADQLSDTMIGEGLSGEEAARRFWRVYRQGLLTTGMGGHLHDHQ
jgi:hypothetical protein